MLSALRVGCVAVAVCVAPIVSVAQEGPAPARVIVRAESKDEAVSLQPGDLRVRVNGKDTPVQAVQPLFGGATPVQVAILIDDGLRANFGNQVEDIRRFAAGMASQHVAVGVAYMQNGRAVFGSGGFTSDPDVVAKQLRLPMSGAGISGSPYFCLQDLVKHWPGDTSAARVVLMITNGIDLYNGSVAPQNQSSPYVQEAIQDAQRAAIPVYSIYYGRFNVNPGLGSFSGQSYLGDVADSTGGQLFNQGIMNPPSIAPYLKQFERSLRESWMVTFQMPGRKLEQLRVDANHGIKLHAQGMVMAKDSPNGSGLR